MEGAANNAALEHAQKLYTEAVSEVPPNRTTLDHLVDYLRDTPELLYSAMFDTAYEAANTVVNVCHEDEQEDDNLVILTPPAAWGWAVMEEAVCRAPPSASLQGEYPGLVKRFLGLAGQTIGHSDATPRQVVRRAVQATTRLWPVVVARSAREQAGGLWQELFEATLALAEQLRQLSGQSDDPALQIHLVKFLEVEATIFSAAPYTDGDDGRGALSLEIIPEGHTFLDRNELARRGELARQQLLHMLPSSDSPRLCNITFATGVISSLVLLLNLRPQFCAELLERLTEWYAAANSSEQILTHAQLLIVGKSLRIALLALYTRRYMGEYAEVLEHTLDNIGGPDWAAWQDRQARERERRSRHRVRERGPALKPSQIPPPPPQPQSQQGDRGTARAQQPPRAGDQQAPKRAARADDDEDEEAQSRMLAEHAKRVKLDEVGDVATGPAPKAATDAAMAAQMQRDAAASTFALKPAHTMTAAERAALIADTMRRVAASSRALDAFVARSRQHAPGTGVGVDLGAPRQLSNGLSTNTGVLEDSVLVLVRLVAGCYIFAADTAVAEDKPTDMSASSRWAEMHASVEGVLQEIADAPRARYGLGVLLLYELWLAVVSIDPSLRQTPDMPGCECSLYALYLRWSERIFDAVVSHSIAATLAQAPVQPVPEAAAGSVPAIRQPDRLALDFILDAPYLPPRFLEKLDACFKTPGAAVLGFSTLEKAIEMRPPVFKAGLNVLLTYCVSHDRATRIGCIRAVKKHYATSSETQLIEKYARAALKHGIDRADAKRAEVLASINNLLEAEPAESGRDAEVAQLKKKGEQEIDLEMAANAELLLALCTRNMELFLAVFDVYVPATVQVKTSIVRLVVPLIKSVIATPSKVLPVLARFPQGAEQLAINIVRVLSNRGVGVPSREVVQGVLDMQAARGLSAQFIVAVASGMTRAEALKHVGAVIAMLNGQEPRRVLVRDFFIQLTTSYNGRPSVLSPTELLVALHNCLSDGSGAATEEQAKEAVVLFESMRKEDGSPMYQSSIFIAAMNQMVGQEQVPPLMLRTAEVYHRGRKAHVGAIIVILKKLISRKVWDMDAALFQSFAQSLYGFLPGTLAEFKSIPADAVKKILAAEPRLQPVVRDYVKKMPSGDQERFKWLLSA
ncbi:hypothetical protein GGI07_005479 [Coemansia sp. Benny D115]|nr:hypothetical protein GGI07_005479 [Coemansia sp. Benny D115]